MKRQTLALCASLGLAAMAFTASAQIDEIDGLLHSQFIEQDPLINARALEAMGAARGTVAKLNIPATAVAFEANIPLLGETLTIRMAPYSVRTADFRLIRQLPDGSYIDAEPKAPATMRGTIVEIPDSIVAGSIDEHGFQGVIMIPSEGLRFIAEPIVAIVDGTTRQHHLFYEDTDNLNPGGTCGTFGVVDPENIVDPEAGGVPRGAAGDCGGICIAEIACDMDIEWNNAYGGNGTAQIENIINTMNIQYENQVGITHVITTIIERTGPLNSDPYNSTNAGTILNEFSNLWNSTMGGVPRDVAEMFSGKNWSGSTIGLAAVGVVCNISSAYNIVQNIGGFGCRTDLSAHELGHNWNALHCGCPGNTMNSSLTCANVFAASSINSIANFRNSRTCLESFEAETAPLPFFDDFPVIAIDSGNWSGIDGVVINGVGINEPSGTLSLNISGSTEIRSGRMNAQFEDNLVVSYFFQRTGGGNSTEGGDDLVAEFFDNANQWIEFDRQLGSGPDMTSFEAVSVALPNSAEHSDLRIRFRNPSPNAGFDDWFVDDVTVDSVAAVPGPFNLISPANGATGIGLGPAFTWGASENATFYTIEVDDNADFMSPEFATTTPFTNASIPGSPLDQGTVYNWRITASNINGDTFGTPAVATFTTLANPPVLFFMFDPGVLIGEMLDPPVSQTPTLRWSESTAGVTYEIEIDDNDDFSSPEFTTSGDMFTLDMGNVPPAFEFDVPGGQLAAATQYYWTVSATNVGGTVVAAQGALTFITDGAGMPVCLGDCDDNGTVDFNDLIQMLFVFGTDPGDGCDANEDSTVDFNDLIATLFLFGPCP